MEKWLILLLLAVVSGVLGRMGGSTGYNTKWRDLGCSLVALMALWLFIGFNLEHWKIYAVVFVLQWAAFSTYWDRVFGYDNLGFSGLAVGMAALPVVYIEPRLLLFLLTRAILLAVIWWALNRFLPKRVLVWNRDVAEEFTRYFISL
jgi:hypothetical protein